MTVTDTDRMPRPTGIVGLDEIGAAIAQRLAASGRRVIGFDASPDARAALAGKNKLIELATNHIDVAAECDVVLLRAADRDAKLMALLGTEDRPGVATGLPQGALIIDLAPTDDDLGQRLSALLGQAAIGYIEARLIGDVGAIEAGEALMLIGGWHEFTKRALGYLRPLGTARAVGQLGEPQAAAEMLAAFKSMAGTLQLKYRLPPEILSSV